jgi:hypothetical protein
LDIVEAMVTIKLKKSGRVEIEGDGQDAGVKGLLEQVQRFAKDELVKVERCEGEGEGEGDLKKLKLVLRRVKADGVDLKYLNPLLVLNMVYWLYVVGQGVVALSRG